MARTGAKSLLLLAVCFYFFTPGKTQLPPWIGQLGNLNVTLSNLLKELSGFNLNTSLPELLAQLNSTEGRKMFEDISKAFGQVDFAFLVGSQVMNSLQSMPLGQCGRDWQRIMNNSREMMAYLDAAGKPPTGILRGNVYWSVNVEQCRAISNSHMCGSLLALAAPPAINSLLFIRWSGCFPSSCNSQNVSAIMSAVAEQVRQLTNNRIFLIHHGSECSAGGPSYDAGARWSLALCAILLLFCLIGTILDVIIEAYTSGQNTSPSDHNNIVELQPVEPVASENDTLTCPDLPQETIRSDLPRFFKSNLCEVFLCFSLVRNTKKIFNTNVPATAITSINGIRVFSIWWVILGHTFLVLITGTSTNVVNSAQIGDDAKRLSVMPVINAYFAVDSFFFLSGLLVAYTCFRKMAKGDGKFNWALFYVHRFWRLTPSYMFVILFTVHLKGLISNKPLWHYVYKDAYCEDKWWTNLLYINNFYPEEFTEECIGWTWYLANDMQFYVISPILLILVFKYGWRGLVFSAGTLLCISSIVIAALIGAYDVDPLINLKEKNSEEDVIKSSEYNNYVYSKPYCRIQPYLVGFILGYAFYMKYRGPIKRCGWLIALIGWSVAFAIAMTLVYAPYQSILSGNREWNMAENIFYGTFQRLLWGLVLAWVTYACHYGYGSYIQQFLSARFWIPLSRLTYSVYLVHMIVLQFMMLATNGTIHYDLPLASYYFIAGIVLCYAVGYILAVVIEFPSENLENLVFKLHAERKKYAVNS